MSNLGFLTKSRGYKRSQISKLHTKVGDGIEELSEQECKNPMSKLEQLSVEVQKLDSEITSLTWAENEDDDEFDTAMEECEGYNEKVYDTLTLLRTALSGHENSINNVNPLLNNQGHGPLFNSRLKLPEVPLPTFSNSRDETLDNFLSTFVNITNKYNLSSYERFILLKGQLKNEPLLLINSLDISKHSYENARDLLTKAFASETTKKFDVIKRLSNLKLSYYINPYELVGDAYNTKSISKH